MGRTPSRPSSSKTTRTVKTPAVGVAATTPVRNTPIPRVVTAQVSRKAITHEMICCRAYEISQSSQCGSEMENWLRAERELSGG